MSRRAVTVVGLTAAAGAGYYLYTAGGDPKVAQKNFQGRSIPQLTTPAQFLIIQSCSRC